jgi:hypothetical protein
VAPFVTEPDAFRGRRSQGAGNCDTEYGVAVFSLANDPPRREWQFKPEGFGQYDVDAWNGENQV